MTQGVTISGNKIAEFVLANQGVTEAVAKDIASTLRAGDVIALWGDLGVGKSTVSRAIIQSLCGVDTVVPSPTFTLVQTYETPKGFDIWHMDMYRLNEPDEAYELGIDDAFSRSCCLIEWPDKLGAFLPKNRIDIVIEYTDKNESNHRLMTVYGSDTEHPLCNRFLI